MAAKRPKSSGVWSNSGVKLGAGGTTGAAWPSSPSALSVSSSGATGAGVGVALIDTGVAPVQGLDAGQVRHGPDLSFEANAPELRHLDTYGHGTHMAGLIVGRDADAHPTRPDADGFLGMAPDAHLISLKVADAHGVTDVSQATPYTRKNGLDTSSNDTPLSTHGV